MQTDCSLDVLRPSSTRPNAHTAIPAALNEIPIFDSDPLDRRRKTAPNATCSGPSIGTKSIMIVLASGVREKRLGCSGATVPVSSIGFVVNFNDGVRDGGDDVAGVEHHRCDWGVVGEGVVDAAGTEIPYLDCHQR